MTIAPFAIACSDVLEAAALLKALRVVLLDAGAQYAVHFASPDTVTMASLETSTTETTTTYTYTKPERSKKKAKKSKRAKKKAKKAKKAKKSKSSED